jgi:hypothetical protein
MSSSAAHLNLETVRYIYARNLQSSQRSIRLWKSVLTFMCKWRASLIPALWHLYSPGHELVLSHLQPYSWWQTSFFVTKAYPDCWSPPKWLNGDPTVHQLQSLMAHMKNVIQAHSSTITANSWHERNKRSEIHTNEHKPAQRHRNLDDYEKGWTVC